MAKINGPLLSANAQGKYAGSVIFRDTKNGSIATRFHSPGSVNPVSPSAAQLAHRALYGAAVAAWQALTAPQQAAYDVLANPENISGWNYFLRQQLSVTTGIIQQKFSTKSVSSIDQTVVFDTPPLEGNLIVAFIHHRNTTAQGDITLPGFSTAIYGISSAVAKLFYKIAGPSESSSVTILTNGVSASGVMGIVELSGVDQSSPFDSATANASSSTVLTLPSDPLSTVSSKTQIICFAGIHSGGNGGSFLFTDDFDTINDGKSTGASFSGGGWGFRDVTLSDTYSPVVSWTDSGRPIVLMSAFKSV